jgi:hypothetical protein
VRGVVSILPLEKPGRSAGLLALVAAAQVESGTADPAGPPEWAALVSQSKYSQRQSEISVLY